MSSTDYLEPPSPKILDCIFRHPVSEDEPLRHKHVPVFAGLHLTRIPPGETARSAACELQLYFWSPASGATCSTPHASFNNIIGVLGCGQTPPTLCLHSRRVPRAPAPPPSFSSIFRHPASGDISSGASANLIFRSLASESSTPLAPRGAANESPPRRDPPDAPRISIRYLAGPRTHATAHTPAAGRGRHPRIKQAPASFDYVFQCPASGDTRPAPPASFNICSGSAERRRGELTPRICNASHASCFTLHAFNDRTEHGVAQKFSIIFSGVPRASVQPYAFNTRRPSTCRTPRTEIRFNSLVVPRAGFATPRQTRAPPPSTPPAADARLTRGQGYDASSSRP
ncbi:hypothetical protein FB451DRAFT_1469230 [Mycena latifolia]|nr:hypothetical protein FB451DRAFT_1469230 [Mycena latifolia]